MDTQVLGISGDHPFSQRVFAKELKLPFPLLSDRSLDVVKEYDVWWEEENLPQRAYFIIDKEGIVRYKRVMEDPQAMLDTEELLAAARRINKP